MLSRIFLASLSLAGLVNALPQRAQRRQAPGPPGPSSAASVLPMTLSPVSMDSSMMSSMEMPMPSSSMASMPVPVPSMSMSMSMSMSASASGAMSSSAASAAYPCPSGYLLTYVEQQQTYMNGLDAFQPILFDWQNATYMYYINGTGGNTPGATRTLAAAAPQPPKMEVLSSYLTNETGIALELIMNLTSGPIIAGQTMISNYSTDLQVYNNATASTGGMNATTVKLFCNFCAADQNLGQAAVSMSFQDALNNIMTLLSGGTVPATPPMGGAMPASSMAMPSMPSAMSSMPSSMMASSMSAAPVVPPPSMASSMASSASAEPVVTLASSMSM